MKNDKSKNIIIALLVVIIVILGTIIVLLATNTISFKPNSIDDNSIQLNEKNEETNNNSTSEDIEKENNNTNINLSGYKGTWYQDENTINQESIEIKAVSNNKITINIFFYRIASMQDTVVTMDGNTGTFSALTEDGLGNVDGTITLNNNQIIVTINNSTIGLSKGRQYIFKYQSQYIDLSGYKGTWYQDENTINQESIEIKAVSNNKITMNIFFYRIASMQDTVVTMNGNTGIFYASTEDGLGDVEGTIIFNNNQIIVKITKSTIGLSEGRQYIFTHKS